MKTDDSMIRTCLQEYLVKSSPNGTILHEIGISRKHCVADVVLADNQLRGFEIKSDRDTLARLPLQIPYYNQVFQEVTLVTGLSHAQNVLDKIPEWWGLWICDSENITVTRAASLNPSVNPASLAQLIWREEAVALLKEHQLYRGLSGKRRRVLWNTLVRHLDTETIQAFLLQRFKERQWRSSKTI